MIQWLRFYDWIRSGEGPYFQDETIIEDDDALDDAIKAWSDDLKKRRSESSKPNQSSSKSFQIG